MRNGNWWCKIYLKKMSTQLDPGWMAEELLDYGSGVHGCLGRDKKFIPVVFFYHVFTWSVNNQVRRNFKRAYVQEYRCNTCEVTPRQIVFVFLSFHHVNPLVSKRPSLSNSSSTRPCSRHSTMCPATKPSTPYSFSFPWHHHDCPHCHQQHIDVVGYW